MLIDVAQPAAPQGAVLAQKRQRRVVLVHGARRQLSDVAQVLRSVAEQLDLMPTINGLSGGSYDLVLVEYDALLPADRQELHDRLTSGQLRSPILVLASGQNRRDFATLFGSSALMNLVARNDDKVAAEDLLVTVQKLLGGEVFGLEKYFAWGVPVIRRRVQRSAEKTRVLMEALEFARRIGVKPRLASLYYSVADELVSNALYNAPVDEAGQWRHSALPRETEVELQSHEAVEVGLCCDGRRLGISVTDPFGSLGAEKLLGHISRCYQDIEVEPEQKAGGAGLGLFFVFRSLNHLVVNVCPSVRTEMIGLIDVTGSYVDFASKTKSFNLFFGALPG